MNANLQIGKPAVLRAVAVPTSSYVACTNLLSMDGSSNAVALEIIYTKGDETSLQVKLEVSNDGGTTYTQQVAESTSSGTVTVALAERSFSATGNYALFITPIKGLLVKISVKATGGTPTGTVGVRGFPTWV